MNLEIGYSKSALAFLDKNSDKLTLDVCDILVIKAIRKIYKIAIESIDLKKLKGKEGCYRIRKGDIRIIFELKDDGCVLLASINEIDFRGSVYK